MSSHHLLSQLNQQQQQMPISSSASSTTINSSFFNNDQIEVITSTDSTPTKAISPSNKLAKFPSELNDNVIMEEETIVEKDESDPQEAMVESVHAKTATLANKLSRSFFDLTQGSQDRLAKWKSKLENYGQKQRQRSTEKETNNKSRFVILHEILWV